MHLAFLMLSVLATWKPPSNPAVRMEAEERDGWKLTSSQEGEFSLFSVQEYKARPGDTFEVVVRVRVDIHTKALPELACFDASGREIPIPSSLSSMSDAITTNWQTYRRVFPVRPGTASVGVRLRASGRGEVRVAGLEFRPLKIDTYQTGALYVQIHPRLRRGLVLESNLGIVNTGLVSNQDRDGDGKWALINIDLDKLSEPEQAGEDWRTKFEYRPNVIYWSDGAVLKSDSVTQDRPPDAAHALHFRMKVHPGPYRAILNDPGRAVAVSLDGKSWKRYEGSSRSRVGHRCGQRRIHRSVGGRLLPRPGHRRAGLLRLRAALPRRRHGVGRTALRGRAPQAGVRGSGHGGPARGAHPSGRSAIRRRRELARTLRPAGSAR